MKKLLIGLTVIVALLVLFLMMGPFYIIDEGSQAVVTRFGKIVDSHTDAGLYFKMPFVDQVTLYPKRILSLDGEAYRIPTKENQFIILDATSRWRISDPEKFYQSLKTLDNAYNRLADIVDSATRTIVAQNRLSEVVRSSNLINENIITDVSLSDSENQIESLINARTTSEIVTKGRRQLSFEMLEEARKMTDEYGIDLIDILPRQIKYSDEMTESVYNRMIKERNQVAEAYRSKGEGDKAEWLGKLEKDKLTIESEAYRKAEEIKGQADAEAAAIYAEAYDVDKEFYSFWKSLESYKQTFSKFDATFTTDMDYFDYLYSAEGNR
ncbi:MAG: protease modulator HflC [Spirochaetaceae bacterium]|nr:protease modulator HflC [Spirochaetaceae bacterium]